MRDRPSLPCFRTQKRPPEGRLFSSSSQIRLGEFAGTEKERAFDGSVFVAVGAVHGVGRDTLCEVRANRAWSRFSRVGCADQGAEVRHGVVLLKDGRHDGSRRHVLRELTEERTLLVHRVERSGIVHAQLGPLHRFDGEAGTDDAVNDFASIASARCVGLDHGESAVGRHGEKIGCLRFWSAKVHRESRMSTEGGQVAPYFRGMNTNATLSSADLMALEDAHGAHNYHPLPVVLDRGEGVHVWDVEGKQYFDFLSAYSAVNQGHCHPRIVKVMQDQTAKLTLTSRAFYNSILGPYEKYVTEYFGYDKVLPMNTGAEAVETAIKIARKWAYDVKGVPSGAAKIITCSENFHGRTTTIVSFSTDPDSTGGFGPYTPGFEVIPYNDLDALATALKDPNVAGFLVEPIQGEAGVNVPADDYIREAHALCKAANVLFMADEVQTGIARTGALLATCGNCTCKAKCERQSTYVKADLLILGKAISGGAYPVSSVLADDAVMGVIHPGQHGSTFGGNPVAGVVATEALAIVADEKLAQNARALGARFREAMQELVDESPLLKSVRGRGLLNAVLINDTPDSSTAWDLCVALKDNGLLAKPTHGNIIRFAPPLVMTAEQLEDCIGIITKTVREFTKA